jgi:adenosylhomocysteine nucleosidase
MAGTIRKGLSMKRVKVLLVEDEDDKRAVVRAEVNNFFAGDVEFHECATFGEATRAILQVKFDFIVIDLLLPRRVGEQPIDVSEEMIEHLTESALNRLTTVVAISRHEDLIGARQSAFVRAGIFLVGFSDDTAWQDCLKMCMQKAAFASVYDFAIVCALEMERSAFEAVRRPDFEYGELLTIHGLDARELRIGDLRGVCVLQPHMGLVDASIIAARTLDAFDPRLICMAGICGGFSEEIPIGGLVVSDCTWEHQAGKWLGSKFEIRSYQEPLSNDTRICLSQLIESDPLLAKLASGRHEIAVPSIGAFLRPTVSGSAVIASGEYADAIKLQHGKVAGIDMEVFGVHRAAALHGGTVICFAAKTVVDHANEAKGDDMQEPGAILSARFVIEAINRLLQ